MADRVSGLEIHILNALQDNYIYLAKDHKRKSTFVVDPGEAGPAIKALQSLKWNLDYILCTHHHNDHVGGNLELKAHTGAMIVGPKKDAHRIPGVDLLVSEELVPSEIGLDFSVLEVPGHTSGHVAYFFKEGRELFCGDTLFLSGCGRILEGTPQELLDSLYKLAALPLDTQIYCGHEYTLNNSRFALVYEPDNAVLKQKISRAESLAKQGHGTMPGSLQEELETNPFLRVSSLSVKNHLNLDGYASDLECFTRLREAKNIY